MSGTPTPVTPMRDFAQTPPPQIAPVGSMRRRPGGRGHARHSLAVTDYLFQRSESGGMPRAMSNSSAFASSSRATAAAPADAPPPPGAAPAFGASARRLSGSGWGTLTLGASQRQDGQGAQDDAPRADPTPPRGILRERPVPNLTLRPLYPAAPDGAEREGTGGSAGGEGAGELKDPSLADVAKSMRAGTLHLSSSGGPGLFDASRGSLSDSDGDADLERGSSALSRGSLDETYSTFTSNLKPQRRDRSRRRYTWAEAEQMNIAHFTIQSEEGESAAARELRQKLEQQRQQQGDDDAMSGVSSPVGSPQAPLLADSAGGAQRPDFGSAQPRSVRAAPDAGRGEDAEETLLDEHQAASLSPMRSDGLIDQVESKALAHLLHWIETGCRLLTSFAAQASRFAARLPGDTIPLEPDELARSLAGPSGAAAMPMEYLRMRATEVSSMLYRLVGQRLRVSVGIQRVQVHAARGDHAVLERLVTDAVELPREEAGGTHLRNIPGEWSTRRAAQFARSFGTVTELRVFGACGTAPCPDTTRVPGEMWVGYARAREAEAAAVTANGLSSAALWAPAGSSGMGSPIRAERCAVPPRHMRAGGDPAAPTSPHGTFPDAGSPERERRSAQLQDSIAHSVTRRVARYAAQQDRENSPPPTDARRSRRVLRHLMLQPEQQAQWYLPGGDDDGPPY